MAETFQTRKMFPRSLQTPGEEITLSLVWTLPYTSWKRRRRRANASSRANTSTSDDYEKYHDALPHSLPKRIAKEMRENLRDMNDAFEELARKLSSFEENEDAVHEQSDFVLSKAMEFAERSRLTIENARIKLARCRLRREKMSVTNSILMLPVFLENVFSGEHVFLALAILAIVIFAISTGKEKEGNILVINNKISDT